MKKPFKLLLLVFGSTLALLIAGAVYIVATFNPNDYKPKLVQLVKDQTGRTLSIPGDIRLTFFPRLGVELGSISLSQARGEQVFAAVKQMHVSVALLPLLAREVVVDRVLIDGLSLQLHRDRNGRYNFDDLLSARASSSAKPGRPAEPAQPAAGAMPRLDIGAIALTHASLDFRDDTAQRHLRVSNLNFTTGPIADGRKSSLDFSADVSVNQPQLALRLVLKSGFTPELTQQRLQVRNLSFSVTSPQPQYKDLALQLGASEAAMATRAVQLNGLTLDARAPNPAGGVLALKTKGQASLDLAREAVQLALEGTLDSTTLALKTGVRNFSHPAADFELALGELDIDRYLPKTDKPAPPAGGGTAAGTGGPEADIDLSALHALDAHGTLKVAALKVMNLRTSNIRMQIKTRGGQLDVNPLTATLYGGGVNGALSAAAGQPQRLSARLDLRGISIGPLLKDLLKQQPLDGRGNLAINVTTEGRTVSQFKRALNGTAGLQLQDGAINGINIASMLRRAKAKTGGGGQEGSASAQEKTDFTEFSASFKIRNGVAHNDDLAAKTPLLRLGGAGDIHIAEDRLDYTVKATVVATLQGQGGPELEQLKGLTIPVRLSGPYTALTWKVDLGGLAAQRAKELVEQRKAQAQEELQKKLDADKAAAQQRLREQAEERLKNLLRR